MALPLVDGLTETSQEGAPLHERLARFLAQRPGAAGQHVQEALTSLERGFSLEGDEKAKARIAAAISMLRGVGNGDRG